LPEDLTLTSNPLKTLTIEPVLLIFFTVAIPSFALTLITPIDSAAILTFALTLITPIISALALAELTLLLTLKIAVALSPATCIPTEPQVQPQTLLTLYHNCQVTFTLRN
jgi:hypothetical protein